MDSILNGLYPFLREGSWDRLTRRHHMREEVKNFHLGRPCGHDDLEQYFAASMTDFTLFSHFAFQATQKDLDIKTRHFKSVVIDECKEFRAFAKVESESRVNLTITFGTFLALDDFTLRLSCNSDYFSFDPLQNGKKLWLDGECLWTIPHSNCKPHTRFFDYSTTPLDTTGASRKSWLGAVVGAYPQTFPRQRLAELMMHIAITWIMLHEEQHYLDGHLSMLRDHPELFSAAASDENNQFPEGLNLIKLMEWQADGAATKGVLDIFYAGNIKQNLPPYCQGNKDVWSMRVILSSISIVLLLIQNSRINHAIERFDFDFEDEDHQQPRDRLLTTIINMIEWNNRKSSVKLDFQDLAAVLIGSFNDSNTASRLLGAEGNPNNEMERWQQGVPPKFIPKKELEMLDDPDSAQNMAYAILSRVHGFKMAEQFPEVSQGDSIDEMACEIFSKYDEEIAPFIGDIEKATALWRSQFVVR